MELKARPCITKPSCIVDVFKAGHLDDVKVYVSHEMWGGRVGGLEAVEEHVVTRAVRLAVQWLVGEVVPAGESLDLGGAEVVRAAAAVQASGRAKVVVVCCYVACAAPLCTCKYNNDLISIQFPSA